MPSQAVLSMCNEKRAVLKNAFTGSGSHENDSPVPVVAVKQEEKADLMDHRLSFGVQ